MLPHGDGVTALEINEVERRMNLQQHYGMLLGLTPQWRVTDVRLEIERRRVEIQVEWVGGKGVPCPECGLNCPVYDMREERQWRHLDTMQFETIICCRTPRCNCPEHGVVTIETPWAGKHGRFTLMFEAFSILVLQSCSNVKAAAQLLGLSWHQVNEIRKRAVERGLDRRGEDKVEYVGLDEKSFGKHHDYISVLTDLSGGRVLEVARERKEESAQGLLQTLSAWQRSAVMAVALDMWPAFMNAARAQLPEAVLVHDKFHVSKHLNEAVDKVRKAENKALLSLGDDRLKGSKYLFLKRKDRLKPSQRAEFEALRSSNLKTSRAWSIKELFNEFWTFDFGSDAQAFFKHWYGWAVRSRLKPISEKAKMLKKHWEGLLGYILHPITNAVTEGLNSKIQQIKASARGFRSFDSYRTAILFYCGKLDMIPDQARQAFPQKS